MKKFRKSGVIAIDCSSFAVREVARRQLAAGASH